MISASRTVPSAALAVAVYCEVEPVDAVPAPSTTIVAISALAYVAETVTAFAGIVNVYLPSASVTSTAPSSVATATLTTFLPATAVGVIVTVSPATAIALSDVRVPSVSAGAVTVTACGATHVGSFT